MSRRFSLNIPLTLVVIFWAFNFIAMKRIYEEVPPASVALLRFLGVWGLLVIYCKFKGHSLKIPREDAIRILMCGFTAMGIYMIPFMEALKLTSPTNCSIILATAPIFTILFSWATGQEKSSIPILLGTGVAFIGVSTVIAGGHKTAVHESLLGDGLALLSAIIWAWATILLRPLLDKYEPVRLYTMSLPGALPALLPYGLWSLLRHPLPHFSPELCLLFAHITVLSGVVAFVCFYVGFQQTSATTTMLYQFSIPPMAAFFAWLWFRQPVTLVQVLGIGIVVLGVWSVSVARQKLLAGLVTA